MIFILIDVAKFPSRSLTHFSFSQQEWECLFPHPLLPRSHQSSEFCPLKSENQFKMCISFIMKDAIDTFKEDYQWPVGLFFCVVCFGFGFASCTHFPAPPPIGLLFSYWSTGTFDILSQPGLCHISYRYFFPVCLKTFEVIYNIFWSSENLIFLFKWTHSLLFLFRAGVLLRKAVSTP